MIPKYVRDSGHADGWSQVYSSLLPSRGDAYASLAANVWLRGEVSKELIARSTRVRETIKFTINPEGEFVKRTDSGEEYITAVLQDVYGDKDGISWSEDVLKKFAQQINANPIIGDVDHEEYDRVLSAAMTDDQVRGMLKGKRGIAKTVEAVFQNGKLWIKALIDKRYRRTIERTKGLSLEAVVTRNGNSIVDGDILGFTFAVNDDPANPRAVIA
jgi:hypothetical protein